MSRKKQPRQANYDPATCRYLIPLTRGDFAVVDLEDVEWLTQWDWHRNSEGYAVRMDRDKSGKRLHVRMHRALAERWGWPIASKDVDHWNRDGLDNRRENLRPCTRIQNSRNRGPQKNNTSGYKGVTWNKRAKRWEAKIWLNGGCIHLGKFERVEDAAAAYAAAAAKHYGEFAHW